MCILQNVSKKIVTVSAGITILESKSSFIQKKHNNAIYIILLNHRKAVFSHFRFVFTYMSKPVKSCLKPFREHTPHKYSIKSTKRVKSLVQHIAFSTNNCSPPRNIVIYKVSFFLFFSSVMSFFVIKNSPKQSLAIDLYRSPHFPSHENK